MASGGLSLKFLGTESFLNQLPAPNRGNPPLKKPVPKSAQICFQPFETEPALLHDIASRFSQFHVPFTWMDALMFAKALRRLEKGSKDGGIQQGSRVLFALAAHEAGCIGSTPQTLQISEELMP